MKTIDMANAPAWLARYPEDPNQDPVIVTISGKPVAVVLPTEGADVDTISVSFHPTFLAIMERSQKRYYQEGGISSAEIRKRFGLPPAKDQDLPTKKKKITNSRKKAPAPKRNRKEDGSQV